MSPASIFYFFVWQVLLVARLRIKLAARRGEYSFRTSFENVLSQNRLKRQLQKKIFRDPEICVFICFYLRFLNSVSQVQALKRKVMSLDLDSPSLAHSHQSHHWGPTTRVTSRPTAGVQNRDAVTISTVCCRRLVTELMASEAPLERLCYRLFHGCYLENALGRQFL